MYSNPDTQAGKQNKDFGAVSQTSFTRIVRRVISTSPGFLGKFSPLFFEHPIIKLQTKRITLNLLFKFSYLYANFTLTLGYIKPALRKTAQKFSSVCGYQ